MCSDCYRGSILVCSAMRMGEDNLRLGQVHLITAVTILFHFIVRPGAGCILLLNGWQPLSVQERAYLADVVVTGRALATYKNNRTEAKTYSAKFRIIDVLKGREILHEATGESVGYGVYNISNFGDRVMCFADVTAGETYILYLTTFQNHLSAKYDDIFGAAVKYSVQSEEAVLLALGWKMWSGWSACSHSCRGGIQTRRRKCVRRKPKSCEGPVNQRRQCNNFSCENVRDLLSILSLKTAHDLISTTKKRSHRAIVIDPTIKRALATQTSEIFNDNFPSEFSLLIRAKTTPEARGYLMTVTDKLGKIRLGVQIGEDIILEYGGQNYASVSRSRERYRSGVTDANAWQSVAFSVARSRLTVYVDCIPLNHVQIKQDPPPQVPVDGVISIGHKYSGELEQLLISDDPRVAGHQCSQRTRQFDNKTGRKSKNKVSEEVSDGLDETTNSGKRSHKLTLVWSPWSQCSVTCGGGGQEKRLAYCVDESLKKQKCEDDKKSVQTRACRRGTCLGL